MARAWKTPRPRRRRLRRLGIPERVAGRPRFQLRRTIRTVSLAELNEAEKRSVAAAIAHRTDLRFIDTLESIAAQLEGVGLDAELELALDEPAREAGALPPARTPGLDLPDEELVSGDFELAVDDGVEEAVAEAELEAEAVPVGTVSPNAADLYLEDRATEVVPIPVLEDGAEPEDEAGDLDLDLDLDLDEVEVEEEDSEDDSLELSDDDLELEPDEILTLPGVPPPRPPDDSIEGTTDVLRVPPSDEELLAGAVQLGPGPVSVVDDEPVTLMEVARPAPEPAPLPPMAELDPDEGVTEIVHVPPPEEESEGTVEPDIAQLGPAPGESLPAEEAIAIEDEPVVASLDDPPDDAAMEPESLASSWDGAGLESWDGHSLEEYMGRPADSNTALESWDGHSLEEYMGRPADPNAGLESWDGHSLEEYLGRGIEGEDSLASWDGHSLEEYLGNLVPDAPAPAGSDPAAGSLPPTADPDDETPDDADLDYLGGGDEGPPVGELDLEPVQGDEEGDVDLARELDEVMDMVSSSGGELAVDAGHGIPPVGDDGTSSTLDGERDSPDPDTIIARDDPPAGPALPSSTVGPARDGEPSVDYLEWTPEPPSPAEPRSPEQPAEAQAGDMPDWLRNDLQPGEATGEVTGSEEQEPSVSVESIPDSARLSALIEPVDDEDGVDIGLSEDLELDVEEDDAPTPARNVRPAAPADRIPTVGETESGVSGGGGPGKDR